MSSIYPEDGGGPIGARPQPSDRSAETPLAEGKQKLAEAGEALRGEAAHFAERARDEVTEKVEAKTEAVTDALTAFSDAIRKAGDELGGQDQTFAAKLASQAADGLQSFSRNLAGKSPEDLLHAARDLGRTNPTAFLAGAVLAGVALGRFARSSASHAHAQDTSSPPAQTGLGDQQAEPAGTASPESAEGFGSTGEVL